MFHTFDVLALDVLACSGHVWDFGISDSIFRARVFLSRVAATRVPTMSVIIGIRLTTLLTSAPGTFQCANGLSLTHKVTTGDGEDTECDFDTSFEWHPGQTGKCQGLGTIMSEDGDFMMSFSYDLTGYRYSTKSLEQRQALLIQSLDQEQHELSRRVRRKEGSSASHAWMIS